MRYLRKASLIYHKVDNRRLRWLFFRLLLQELVDSKCCLRWRTPAKEYHKVYWRQDVLCKNRNRCRSSSIWGRAILSNNLLCSYIDRIFFLGGVLEIKTIKNQVNFGTWIGILEFGIRESGNFIIWMLNINFKRITKSSEPIAGFQTNSWFKDSLLAPGGFTGWYLLRSKWQDYKISLISVFRCFIRI